MEKEEEREGKKDGERKREGESVLTFLSLPLKSMLTASIKEREKKKTEKQTDRKEGLMLLAGLKIV